MKTTIDSAGRVVIPKSIRDGLGLTAGTELEIRLDNGMVEILRSRPSGRMIEQEGHLFWEPSAGSRSLSTAEINQAIDDARTDRDEAILYGSNRT